MQRKNRTMDPSQGLRASTGLAAAILVVGLAMLAAYSIAEAVVNPGYSIVDGYWVGRLPWMGLIEALVVAGATATVLVGAVTVFAIGGWLHRAVILLPITVSALWWLFAYARAGISGGACVDCAVPPFDPWAYAYSAPQLAFLMLVLPAVLIASLALTIRPGRTDGAGYISPS